MIYYFIPIYKVLHVLVCTVCKFLVKCEFIEVFNRSRMIMLFQTALKAIMGLWESAEFSKANKEHFGWKQQGIYLAGKSDTLHNSQL